MSLTALVIGAGWAAEGHSRALRAAGVEVAALCGRTPEPAYAMASKLGVREVRFDWRAALDEFQPDIVSIATPAPSHYEIALAAAKHGCHVACDKPLGLTSAEALGMYQAAEQAYVKHVYGATGRYRPEMRYARSLLSEGMLGRIQDIEYTFHEEFPPLHPFSWYDQVGLGGGTLFNLFTHQLEQVRAVTGGTIVAATGEAHRLFDRVPVAGHVHDFRDVFAQTIDPVQAASGEWREADADLNCTVLTCLRLESGQLANVVFLVSGAIATRLPMRLLSSVQKVYFR